MFTVKICGGDVTEVDGVVNDHHLTTGIFLRHQKQVTAQYNPNL